jgi:hypothetical protein
LYFTPGRSTGHEKTTQKHRVDLYICALQPRTSRSKPGTTHTFCEWQLPRCQGVSKMAFFSRVLRVSKGGEKRVYTGNNAQPEAGFSSSERKLREKFTHCFGLIFGLRRNWRDFTVSFYKGTRPAAASYALEPTRNRSLAAVRGWRPCPTATRTRCPAELPGGTPANLPTTFLERPSLQSLLTWYLQMKCKYTSMQRSLSLGAVSSL